MKKRDFAIIGLLGAIATSVITTNIINAYKASKETAFYNSAKKVIDKFEESGYRIGCDWLEDSFHYKSNFCSS